MSENHPPFVIHVDGKEFKVEKTTLSGAEIKTLVGKDTSYQLFLERAGGEPDLLVNDSDAVTIKNGLHFYTVPPATLGVEWI